LNDIVDFEFSSKYFLFFADAFEGESEYFARVFGHVEHRVELVAEEDYDVIHTDEGGRSEVCVRLDRVYVHDKRV
jgi:hypothetical protein